jgi:hypothetical protein
MLLVCPLVLNVSNSAIAAGGTTDGPTAGMESSTVIGAGIIRNGGFLETQLSALRLSATQQRLPAAEMSRLIPQADPVRETPVHLPRGPAITRCCLSE